MRRLAQVVALVVAVAVARPAHAADRGALSGVGLGFVVLSLMSFGLGVGGLAASSDAAQTLGTFTIPPTQSEVGAYSTTNARLTGGTALGIVGMALGALSLGAGIVCLVLDGPSAKATVTFAPTAGGGTFVLSAQF